MTALHLQEGWILSGWPNEGNSALLLGSQGKRSETAAKGEEGSAWSLTHLLGTGRAEGFKRDSLEQ